MVNIDYSKIAEITVKSQEELDMIPLDFAGRIYIEFGTCYAPAVVKNRYKYRVVARGNSSVVARENSSVEARENSSVEARGNSSVVARGNSSVVARGNSSVEARENSSVEARENSSVVARGNSSVVAAGNTQVVECSAKCRIEITGNARIVHNPKTIHEYCDFYGLQHDKKTGLFYKAVHKTDTVYTSDYNRAFTYEIGAVVKSNDFDSDPSVDCGCGIHVAHIGWALDYGRDWENLAILEVEAELDSIVVPTYGNGKIRVPEAKVIREVPLEECGVFGKILKKRMEVAK